MVVKINNEPTDLFTHFEKSKYFSMVFQNKKYFRLCFKNAVRPETFLLIDEHGNKLVIGQDHILINNGEL